MPDWEYLRREISYSPRGFNLSEEEENYMCSLSRAINLTSVALCSGLVLTVGSALAQGSDSGRLPPPPLPLPTPAPAPGAPAPDSAPAAAPINVQDLTVLPGAGEDKRRALLGRIMEAKNQGIGTSTYMMAFDDLEQSAKGGASEESVLKRVSSLNSSLDDQFKRGAILKVQRATPPIAASAPATPFGS